MNRRHGLMVIAVAVCVAAISTSRGEQAAVGSGDSVESQKVREFLIERRDTLRELVESTLALVAAGRQGNREIVSERQILRCEAELDLADSHDARVKIRQEIVDRRRLIEEIKQARAEASSGRHDEVLLARAERLRAEADLWREKGVLGQ
jgi:hypothetical protein